jgi:hypothetical protein
VRRKRGVGSPPLLPFFLAASGRVESKRCRESGFKIT